MINPDTDRVRKAWVSVMTLSSGRHQHVEFVFDQEVMAWNRLHRPATLRHKGKVGGSCGPKGRPTRRVLKTALMAGLLTSHNRRSRAGYVKNPAASCGVLPKEKAWCRINDCAHLLAIHPHSKLWGILAFSRER